MRKRQLVCGELYYKASKRGDSLPRHKPRIARNVWNIIFFFGMQYEFSTILNMHMRSVSDQIHLHILNFKTPFPPCKRKPWKHHGKKITAKKNQAFPPIIKICPGLSLPDLDHNGRLEAAERKLADHLSFFRLAKYRPLGPRKGDDDSENSAGVVVHHAVVKTGGFLTFWLFLLFLWEYQDYFRRWKE